MRRLVLPLTITVVVVVLVVLLLVGQEVRQGRVSESRLQEVPACESLPERGPDNAISLLVSRAVDYPGVICVRLYNGTQRFVLYERGAIRLECRWIRLVWVPYFRLSDLLARILGLFWGSYEFSVQPVLIPGGPRDSYLPSPYAPAPPGQYRVRFCYREEPEQKEKQCIYSAPFSIPETGKGEETQTATAE